MSFRPLSRQWIVAGFSLCLCAGLAVLAGASALPAFQKKRPVEKKQPPPKTADTSVPFQAGEKLGYRILWTKFAVNAASVNLAVLQRQPFYGHDAWHFQASAHTVDTMRILFALDDQFDSYSDAAALVGLQFEMYLNEQGKQQTSLLRLTTDDDPLPAPASATAVRVLPGTRDALGFLQYLRTVDWRRNPEVRCPVFEGRKLYEVTARLALERGEVSVPAGNFAASKIALRVFERGREVPDTGFQVWLARDAARTPVLLEVEVPFGSGRIELTRAH